MKDSTIITNFNQLANRIKKMEEVSQYNIREIMKNQAAVSLTIEALTNILMTKGIIVGDSELKEAIQNIHAKRSEKAIAAKEQMMAQQPTFENSESSVPAPGEEMPVEETKEA